MAETLGTTETPETEAPETTETPGTAGASGTTFVTTVTRSYVPLARVLMASVQELHPEARRVVLQVDGDPEVVGDAEILRPSDVIADPDELTVLAGIYNPLELSTALKPQLLLRELGSADRVIFLDPDMRLFQRADAALEALASGTGTLLTPHQLVPPVSFRNRELYEWGSKAMGAYNTGFVGVTAASVPFLEWWDSRLRRDCVADTRKQHWVDQKIMDLAPSYFDLDVFRDPAYNVGWWNLEERPLGRVGEMVTVSGVPLVLMHYSGVRPAKPKNLEGDLPYLVYSERNAVIGRPAEMVVVRALEADYIADLMAAGYAELSKVPYGFAVTPGGRVWTDRDRQRYRKLVMAAEGRGETPPTPDELPREPLTWKLWAVGVWVRDGLQKLSERWI